MIEELKQELRDLATQVGRKKKIEAMLKSLRDEERGLLEHVEELKAVLSAEEADVERISKTTISSLLYSAIGRKEIMLDKEQREAYTAKLKYDAAACQLDDCRARIYSLSRERELLLDCERRFDEAQSKLTELLGEDSRYAEPICRFQRGLGEADSQIHELDEAIAAGKQVVPLLDSIESSLDRAEDWAGFDIFGGGLISDLEKHSHLDAAQADAELMQALMSRFRTELADVRINPELGAISIDGFLRFADFFFDGFFADLSVMQHIEDSIESVRNIHAQVCGALSKLESMRMVQVRDKAELERKMSEFLMNA